MPSQKTRIKRIKDQVEDLEDKFTQADSSQKKTVGKGVWTMLSAALTLAGLWIGVAIVPTLSIAEILTGNPRIGVMLLLILGGSVYVSQQSGRSFSLPFAFITIGLATFLWSFLPPTVATALSPERILGTDLPAFNGTVFLIMSVAMAALYWGVAARITGRAKRPEKIADRVVKKFAKLIDVYLTIGMVIALGILYVGYAGLANVGQVIGQVGDVLALEPFLSSNLFAVLTGYLGFGGELPVIGSVPFLESIGPSGWLFIAGGALVLAVAAYYSPTGPTSRLFR